MDIGMVGLGRMGGNMTKRLLRDGHRVVAFARHADAIADAVEAGAEGADSLEALVSKLPARRAVWIMVPSGDPASELTRTGLRSGKYWTRPACAARTT